LIRGIVVGTSSEQQKTEIVAPARASSRPKGTMVWVAVIVVVLIVAGIAGAWAAGLIGGTSDEKVLVIAMSSNVETMDPAKTSAMYGPPGMIYETLITRDLTGAFRPGLAEWWNLNTTDPDHPTFEIRLQQGVTFHDGLPFDTDAVKRIINYYSNEDSWVQYEFWAVYGCENKTGWPDAGIWCKDAYNMVLNLTWADVALQFNLSHLYGSMMGPDALESDGLENYGTVDHKVVGTGPFMLDEWVANDHVTLVKNPDYSWGAPWYENQGAAKIDKIIYRIIPDQAARFAGFESGAIDVLQQVPPNKVQTYIDNPSEYTVITGPGQGTYHVEFNCQKDPWTNASLRRAFGYAIDRSVILETVWHGFGEEGVNYLSPIEPESTNVPAEYNYSYDVDKALELFAIAGYTDTDADDWLEDSAGEELTLPLWTTSKGEDVSMSEILLSQFETVGVHVELTQYSENQLRSNAADGAQDAILFWYSWPRAEILDWHFGTWAAGGSNTGWYEDVVFDNYVTNWTYATTEKQFSDNATAAHIRLLTQGAWAPILFWHQIFAVHNYVTGWSVNPLGQEQVIDIVDVDITK
jgi:peptide/nickel transport system substrate-binding protein